MNARFVHPAYPQIVARNWFEVVDGSVRMELTQGEYAIFDLADLPRLARHRWCAAWFRRNICDHPDTERRRTSEECSDAPLNQKYHRS